ncbi:MAG: hypothetical protein IID14_01490 [Candidatus Marinimicrobia bacterium]|nr:hypothetical protein [Candidatus Neomarinimicrobiota bacterium]
MKTKKGAVLQSLRDIESLFEFGGEITPFLEELFNFLNDLMPILAKAKKSLESTTSAMPGASENIASAEQMAESAAHTIMDTADQIYTGLNDLIAKEPEGETKETLAVLTEKISDISMALQFQDITSQHLKQAGQIVEAIQTRMVKLFNALQSIGEHNELVRSLVEKYAEEDGEDDAIDTADTIRKDDSITQADIDALFGS